MKAALECRDLWFRYGNSAPPILRGINLSLLPREVALVWGLNGAGKTTLGKTCAGLLRPNRGTINIAGGGKCLMVLAEPEKMLLGTTPYEDVRLGPALAALPEPEVERRTSETLAKVGLWGRAHDAITSLSLGEKKRVALAAALAATPSTLILDEPFAFLDDAQVDVLWDNIMGVAAGGVAVLLLSGRAATGERCNRRYNLVDGVVVSA